EADLHEHERDREGDAADGDQEAELVVDERFGGEIDHHLPRFVLVKPSTRMSIIVVTRFLIGLHSTHGSHSLAMLSETTPWTPAHIVCATSSTSEYSGRRRFSAMACSTVLLRNA